MLVGLYELENGSTNRPLPYDMHSWHKYSIHHYAYIIVWPLVSQAELASIQCIYKILLFNH